MLDEHVYSRQEEVSSPELARAVASAANAAKAQGNLPAALQRFADSILTPQVPWREKLRHDLSRAIARDGTTWTKPHRRRLLTQGVYLPAMTGFGAGDVVLVVDTSGSISQEELNAFFTEIDDILTSCSPRSVVLLGCDCEISSVHHLDPEQSLLEADIRLKGGGGTDFCPPFDWVAGNFAGGPAALVYFTDLMGTFPTTAPVYPVIWCTKEAHQVPFGEVIEIK